MRGFVESLVSDVVLRAIGPALAGVLLAAPLRKTTRAQLEKIYVLDEEGEMTGEYVLNPECPIDFNDFLKVLPDEGIGDREALFVGEYVFTAFQSAKTVFVLLSRGQLSAEDVDWTAILLTAADAHLARATKGTAPAPKAPDAKPPVEPEKAFMERESRLAAKERDLSQLEAKLKADEANLKGRAEELERQKAQLAAIAEYGAQMQQSVTAGVSRALQSLEMAEQIAASSQTEAVKGDAAAIAEARKQFDNERSALLVAKDDLEVKYRQASERIKELEAKVSVTLATLDREHQDAAKRDAEADKMRVAIEARVQELSQRFAQMAKERLVNSHKPAEATADVSPAARQEMEKVRAELTKERKFLQRRAIELLDREERVRDLEAKTTEREAVLARREAELGARIEAPESAKTAVPGAAPGPPDAEAARKDIEHRVKIIQQKAMELLDREEKLRKRAAELQELEARLSRKVPAG